MSVHGRALLLLLSLCLPLAAAEPRDVAPILAPLRAAAGIPALAGAVVTAADGLIARGAVGVRRAGGEVPVTAADRWHLGSETKAMTATLAGALVEDGRIAWSTSLAQAIPELAAASTSALANATLLQFLGHRAGLPANPPQGWHVFARGERPLPEQRRQVVKAALEVTLDAAPGTRYQYSNWGYCVAGAMLEAVSGQAWETLMRTRLFEPLGMAGAGFGGVGTPGQLDQPWGHGADGQPVSGNGPRVDNAAVLGPAGTVHATLGDWAAFVRDQLRGAAGQSALLKPETYRALHTPPADGEPYALGWSVTRRDWGGGTVLTHAGCNTMNYAVAWLAPTRGFAVLVVANADQSLAGTPCDKAAYALIRNHIGIDAP